MSGMSFMQLSNDPHKRFRSLLALCLMVLGLAIGTVLVTQRLGEFDSRRQASTSGVDFSFGPPSITNPAPGQTFTLKVYVNTHAHQLTAADLNLTFDPAKLTLQSMVRGNLFNYPRSAGTPTPRYVPNTYPGLILYPVQTADQYFTNTTAVNGEINNTAGSARLALGAPCDRCYLGPSPIPTPGVTPIPSCVTSPAPVCYPVTGTALEVATLTFLVKAGAAGTSNITIAPNTQSASISQDTDATGDRNQFVLTLATPTSIPTTTPPVGTPTATPVTNLCGGADISANGTTLGQDNKVSSADYNYLITRWTGSFATCPANNCGGADISANGTTLGQDNKVSSADYNYLITRWTGSFAVCQ